MRASVQFPREKFVSAACSSASSGTMNAKILSSSVCSSGFICTLEVVADGEATHGPSSVEPGAAAYNAPKVTGGDTGDGLG